MKSLWTVLLACLLVIPGLHAQQSVETYPYCAQYADGTSLDCEFSSLQMCEQSVTGVGGVYIDNPSGPGAAPPASSVFGVAHPMFFTPMPPPTILPSGSQSQATAQMQSLCSDLAIDGGNAPTTLGAINFSGSGSTCIGLLFRSLCRGS
jgi:Protein of unknown function (DUF3551)